MWSPTAETWDDWRPIARQLVAANIAPADVSWNTQADQHSLFADQASELPDPPPGFALNVPKSFLELAASVACHRDAGRFEILYRVLWRITHGERNVLAKITDDDVLRLNQMEKSIRRDVHKMKAFVRFRKVIDNNDPATPDRESFIAWHRPDHRIVRLAAPFFARRFKGMNWTILTPDESVTWDQVSLRFGRGVPVTEAPAADALEDLWKTYYASIFNPARIKLNAMRAEMPMKHWPTLPETSLIPDLLLEANARVETMLTKTEGFARTAVSFFPEQKSLTHLAAAARHCQACPLHESATQTVFGRGPASAKIVLVGEQPGDQEDIAGEPFIGPAGQVLRQAIADAGLSLDEIYLTNVVKHFKFERSGKTRLHKKPGAREIYACRPWLEAELAQLQPATLVCLGATSAQAILGRDFRITNGRGEIFASDWCSRTIATWHPSAILRAANEDRRREMRQQLVDDLSKCHPTNQLPR